MGLGRIRDFIGSRNMWMTLEELAAEFGIPKKTLQNRLSSGAAMPPSYHFCSKRLFKRNEVYQWIENTRSETAVKLSAKLSRKDPR